MEERVYDEMYFYGEDFTVDSERYYDEYEGVYDEAVEDIFVEVLAKF